MSTFNGIVTEFPYLSFDYFRFVPGRPPPLATFLSHIHADHLQGLENLLYNGPMVYCTQVTRDLLMCIDNGKKYGHLRNRHTSRDLVKGLPMNAPVEIEINSEYFIQVTLIDSNHCIGSCMFLIEDNDKSILYTGDIRVDSHFLASLSKHPVLLPYIVNKRLNTIYVDTTFSIRPEPYIEIPPNIQGIMDLIQIIQLYPEETRFFLNTSTTKSNSDCISGYEDIWLYLASAFNAKVHVNISQYLLFENLSSFNNKGSFPFSSYFTGRSSTEKVNRGCLTTQGLNAKFHSCKREECELLKDGNHSQPVVFVQPVVNKTEAEIWDQNRARNLASFDPLKVVDTPDYYAQFLDGCHENIKSRSAHYVVAEDEIYIKSTISTTETKLLPTTLYIPFSRHSSFFEMRELIRLFRPNDVYPCVLPNSPGGKDFRAVKAWMNGFSIKRLFGSECRNLGGHRFDLEMQEFMSLQNQLGFDPHSFPSQLEKICSGDMSSEDDDEVDAKLAFRKSGNSILANRKILNDDPRHAKSTVGIEDVGKTEIRLRRVAQATKLPPSKKTHIKGRRKGYSSEEMTSSNGSNSSVSELLDMLNRFKSYSHSDEILSSRKSDNGNDDKVQSLILDSSRVAVKQSKIDTSSSESVSLPKPASETDIDELSNLLSSVLVPKKKNKPRKQSIHISSKIVRKILKPTVKSGGYSSSPPRNKPKLERKVSLARNYTSIKGMMVRKSWKLGHVSDNLGTEES